MKDPIALEAWERLAKSYAAQVDTKPHNALYERPATLSLLPPVNGKRVLDAGCGPGAYVEWLVKHGAEVVGFDFSPKMVRLAKERLSGRAQVLLGDFSEPLDFLDSESFDIAISAWVLEHVKDWEPAFRELFRVLRLGGHLVFSVGHPADEFFENHSGGDYFDVEAVTGIYYLTGEPVSVPYYRRPLAAMLDPLFDAGFTLERLVEPRPLEEFRDQHPGNYEKLMKHP